MLHRAAKCLLPGSLRIRILAGHTRQPQQSHLSCQMSMLPGWQVAWPKFNLATIMASPGKLVQEVLVHLVAFE